MLGKCSLTWVVMVVSGIVCGCTTATPINLSLDSPADFNDHEIVELEQQCKIVLILIEDDRKRKNDAGSMGPHPILVERPVNWIRSGVDSYLIARFGSSSNSPNRQF